MEEWTQEKIDELLKEMARKAMTDPEFRKEALEDATAALEKLAGRPLPEGASLKCIEKDPNYQSTLVLPDLIDGEKLDDEALAQVAGGLSVIAILSVCAAAVGLGPDILACFADANAASTCGAKMCGAKVCGSHACAAERDIHNFCATYSCAAYSKVVKD